MLTRPLGKTGIGLSEIGFGAWGIGKSMWVGAKDTGSLQALHRAMDLGINFIDTARVYGMGHSEQLVGLAVRERDEYIHVATKVAPKNMRWPASAETSVSETFPAGHIVASCEASLQALGIERIDLLQLHVWHDVYLGEDGWREGFDKLKQEGKIRFCGISVNDHAPDTALGAVCSGLFDSVQVIYNIYDPTAADELLPLCNKHGVGVIARVPLDEGGMSGAITPDTRFPPGDFRADYFRGARKRAAYEHARALEKLLGRRAKSLAELALRFCLSHPMITTVIPGMRSVLNVERNAAMSDGQQLPAPLLENLRAHAWPKNFYEPREG